MSEGGRRKLPGIVAAAVTASLLLGGGLYLWGLRNGAQLSDRNLRELARMGRAIEGQVNNLHTVLSNIAKADEISVVGDRVRVVPNLSLSREPEPMSPPIVGEDAAPRTRLAVAATLDSLELTYEGRLGDSTRTPGRVRPRVRIRARWAVGALRPDLTTDYFDLTLLADGTGTVLLSAPSSTGIRVHSLPVLLDSLTSLRGGGADPSGAGRYGVDDVTMIRRASVAGRSYRVFVQPLRVALDSRPTAGDASTGTGRWLLAGLVEETRFRQEGLAIGPSAVLSLGLILMLGFLGWPFVRAATMGPRERLRVHHLLFLVASLVLISGGVGLVLADLAHYVRLKADFLGQIDALADQHRREIRREIAMALSQLDQFTDRLVDEADGRVIDANDSTMGPTLRKVGLPLEEVGAYPILTMAFWADLGGAQVAKWTPRATNTSLVSVVDRGYFRSIRDGVGWIGPDVESPQLPDSTRRYYVESIRTWTTGEKSAAISARIQPALDADSGRSAPPPVGVVLTRFASLDRPVLPPGVAFALVDTAGRVLFHDRKERALEENLVDETGGSRLLRSTLLAHVDRELDVLYRGRRTRVFVRPIPDTPVSLAVILDKAQLETVRFEAVFVSASLFAALTVLVFVWLALVEVVVPRKMHWVWPDPTAPGRYFALSVVLTLLLAGLLLPVLWPRSYTPHPAHMLVAFQALGLALAAFSLHESGGGTMRRARWFGVGLAVVASLLVIGLQIVWPDTEAGPSAGAALQMSIQAAVTVIGFVVLWLENSGGSDPPQAARLRLQLGPRWSRIRNRFATGPRTVHLYVVAMSLGLLVIGVVPGYLLYRVAFDHQLDLMIRNHQVAMVDGLRARTIRNDSIARDDRLSAGYRDAMDSVTWSLAFQSPPFGVCQRGEAGSRTSFRRKLCPPDSGAGESSSLPLTPRRLLPNVLLDRVPFVSEPAVQMRQLLEEQPDRSWLRTGSERSLTLRDGSFLLASSVPAGIGTPTLWWLLVLPVGIGLLAWIVHWVSRRVFLVELWASPPGTLAAALDSSRTTGHLMVVCTRSTDRAPLYERAADWYVVDLVDRAVEVDGRPSLALPEGKAVMCIDHADHRIREPEWGRAFLDFLEHLVYVDERDARVILLTSQEPGNMLAPDQGSHASEYYERWTRLLGRFTRIAVQDSADRSFGNDLARLIDEVESGGDLVRGAALRAARPLLEQECTRPTLQRIGRHIAELFPRAGMARAELIGRIRDEADSYYRALWAVLGPQEKLVIAQLASGAVVNPSCGGSITRLLGRGIIVRGPELRVMNESFARFVRDNAPESVIVEWERAGYASTWELIRLPFVMGWIVIALFLFWTQRDLLGSTIAFLSTAGVGLAAIVRLLTLFQGTAGGEGSKASSG